MPIIAGCCKKRDNMAPICEFVLCLPTTLESEIGSFMYNSLVTYSRGLTSVVACEIFLQRPLIKRYVILFSSLIYSNRPTKKNIKYKFNIWYLMTVLLVLCVCVTKNYRSKPTLHNIVFC